MILNQSRAFARFEGAMLASVSVILPESTFPLHRLKSEADIARGRQAVARPGGIR